jgi:hypothetical protein
LDRDEVPSLGSTRVAATKNGDLAAAVRIGPKRARIVQAQGYGAMRGAPLGTGREA